MIKVLTAEKATENSGDLSKPRPFSREHWWRLRDQALPYLGLGSGILLLLLTWTYSYLLFHSLAEIFSVIIAFTLFILVWNNREATGIGLIQIIAMGYAAAACLDLGHNLAGQGMNIFKGYDANLPNQRWITARYLQALSLLGATFAYRYHPRFRQLMAAYGFTILILLWAAFAGHLPTAYVEGEGPTSFKVVSEYVIVALFLLAVYRLQPLRSHFSKTGYSLILASALCAAWAELAFTSYIGAYELANVIGHLFKILAYYFLYRALYLSTIQEPFNALLRQLRENEQSLSDSRDTMSKVVEAWTAELGAANTALRETQERYLSIFNLCPDAILILDMEGNVLDVNDQACQQYGYDHEDFVQLHISDIDQPKDVGNTTGGPAWRSQEGKAPVEARHLDAQGQILPVEVGSINIFLDGQPALLILCRDISERKKMHEQIQYLEAAARDLAAAERAVAHPTPSPDPKPPQAPEQPIDDEPPSDNERPLEPSHSQPNDPEVGVLPPLLAEVAAVAQTADAHAPSPLAEEVGDKGTERLDSEQPQVPQPPLDDEPITG